MFLTLVRRLQVDNNRSKDKEIRWALMEMLSQMSKVNLYSLGRGYLVLNQSDDHNMQHLRLWECQLGLDPPMVVVVRIREMLYKATLMDTNNINEELRICLLLAVVLQADLLLTLVVTVIHYLPNNPTLLLQLVAEAVVVEGLVVVDLGLLVHLKHHLHREFLRRKRKSSVWTPFLQQLL